MPLRRIQARTHPAAVKKAVARLGANIATARIRREMRQEDLAQRAGITRPTLSAIESGHPGTSIGAYVAVLRVLGLHHGVAALADPDTDLEGKTLEAARRGQRVRPSDELSNDF